MLIVDDEPHARDLLLLALRDVVGADTLHILHAKNLAEAFDQISSTTIHVVLLDKNLGPIENDPAHDGIEAIPAMLAIQPHLQILMVTGSDDIQDVVKAMKYGSFGYIVKGSGPELLIGHINRALEVAGLKLERIRLERIGTPKDIRPAGNSRVFRDILRQAQLLAESNRPVLLLGETGTGKTEMARWINFSRGKYLKQQDRPFFAINVSTLTKELIESELFGHEKGSFTDAHETRQGLFELACNGTLFLDEIGELPLELQAKLLTVIEDGTFKRIGGKVILNSKPKLIFATNRNLEEMVAKGLFRQDLYHRISMFPITLPPLKERQEDIPEIVRALISRIASDLQIEFAFTDLPPDFVQYLIATPIEGNIRGVRSQLERLIVLSPKDNRGRPIVERWRFIPGFQAKRAELRVALRPESGPISTADILKRGVTLGAEFPGVDEFFDSAIGSLIENLQSEGRTIEEIAKIFGKSKAWYYRQEHSRKIVAGASMRSNKGVIQ